MKRLIPLIGLVLFSLPVFAYAQTGGGIVVLAQSHVDQSFVIPNGKLVEQIFYIGSGYSGSTTGAFLGGTYNKISNADNAIINLEPYTDSSYATPVGTTVCGFKNTSAPIGTTDVNGFVQLSDVVQTNGGCTLQPQYYYRVVVDYSNFSGIFWSNIFGTNNIQNSSWTIVIGTSTAAEVTPTFTGVYFALVGNGFQITPDTNSSGVYLSGAQEFCNNQFGSSTSIGSTIANGLCVVFGYLFIPTQQSISQYSGLGDDLSQKAPVSYVTGLAPAWESLSASSTLNVPTYAAGYHDLGIGSSTALGNILPNFDALSSTTIQKDAPSGTFATLRALLAVAIVVTFGVDIFFSIKRELRKT